MSAVNQVPFYASHLFAKTYDDGSLIIADLNGAPILRLYIDVDADADKYMLDTRLDCVKVNFIQTQAPRR